MSGPGRGGRHGGKNGRGKGSSGRGLKAGTKIKAAKGRTASSARWLERQHADPYVAQARVRGYRSRAAFKLAQMDDRFGFLKRGSRVVDLGAAPGGWTQVALERCGAQARVVALDLNEIEPLEGALCLRGDFHEPDVQVRIVAALEGPADVVLSDMAEPATGHTQTDHLRVMALAEAAFEFALGVLAPGGTLVLKVLQGGTEAQLLKRLKRAFTKLRHVKPPASRPDSAELYLIAGGFRGAAEAGAGTLA